MSFDMDGHTVLVPTVHDNGYIMNPHEAIQNYIHTGKHLGMFDSPGSADFYAQFLHEQQAAQYLPKQGLGNLNPDTEWGR
jgi:hypothetical protein